MRRNLGVKPHTIPQPVFMVATYNEDGSANVMNVAWGGISEEDEISLCIDNKHKTALNLQKRSAFTVSMGEAEYYEACDYLGMVSGNKEPDKVSRAGFTMVAAEFVDAPMIQELAICIECELKSYDPQSCRCVGTIVNISVDERVLTDSGKVDLTSFNPIIFDSFNVEYRLIGDRVGKAFRDGLAWIKKA